MNAEEARAWFQRQMAHLTREETEQVAELRRLNGLINASQRRKHGKLTKGKAARTYSIRAEQVERVESHFAQIRYDMRAGFVKDWGEQP